MKTAFTPITNRLLAELDSAELDRLTPYLELVPLTNGDVLYQADGRMTYAYFPVTATISIDFLLEDGGTSEISRMGNEGMLGVSLFMGGRSSSGRAVVQASGFAYRLSAERLMHEFYQTGALLRIFLRYTESRLTQISQLAVCNTHHTTRQRLCRYLLQMLDRSPSSNQISVTQEQIGAIMGVRRECVTEAVRWLQGLRIVKWQRGRVTVLNRPGLHEHVCECHAAVSHATNDLLSDLPARSETSTNRRTRHAMPFRDFNGIDRRQSGSAWLVSEPALGQAELAFA